MYVLDAVINEPTRGDITIRLKRLRIAPRFFAFIRAPTSAPLRVAYRHEIDDIAARQRISFLIVFT